MFHISKVTGVVRFIGVSCIAFTQMFIETLLMFRSCEFVFLYLKQREYCVFITMFLNIQSSSSKNLLTYYIIKRKSLSQRL